MRADELRSESIVTPLIPAIMTVELHTGSAGTIIDGFSFVGGTRAIVSRHRPDRWAPAAQQPHPPVHR